MIVINFKTYRQGQRVRDLVNIIEKYTKNAIVCLGPSNLHLARSTSVRVFSQHVDYEEKGRSTGFLIPEAIRAEKVKGSLLNHSEHRVSLEGIKKTLKRCKKLNLKIIVCSSSLKEVKEIKKMRPYAIAFEDPDLIGTSKSITEYGSKDVLDFVELLGGTQIIPICGSGINTSEDYLEALGLGCKGILISSAIAKARNPAKLLERISKW